MMFMVFFTQVLDEHGSGSQSLGVCKVPLSQLLESADMTMSRPFALRESGADTTLFLHLCLRVIHLHSSVMQPALSLKNKSAYEY